MVILTALEIYANAKDLEITIFPSPEKGDCYGFVITRGAEHKFKGLIETLTNYSAPEKARMGVRRCLEIAHQLGEANRSPDADSTLLLTAERIEQIIAALEERTSVYTRELFGD